ncbi:MAG: hypothetical protein GX073_03255 [Firmicutes bacterium]|nr:hypothetical protein [Bacillota bacterium]
METNLSQIYSCPHCQLETPHYIMVRREERLAITCSRCRTTSLVHSSVLEDHQAWWETELQQILSGLEEHEDEH